MVILSLLILIFSCSSGKNVVVNDKRPRVIPSGPVKVPPPITGLPDRPDVITTAILEDQLILDANSLSDNDRLNARWLVGCNFYNEGNKDQEGIGDGINLAINSISPENSLERVAPVGAGNCAYRIDLDSYGITRKEWTKIESALLLDFVTETVRGQQLQFLTQALKPYVYASDFFTTTLQADILTVNNGLYYDLVEQPNLTANFYASIGVNVQEEFDNEEAVLASFSQSPIALQKSRSILVIESDDGYVMSTYDSALSNQDSHFQNPFTFEASIAQGVRRSNKVFNFAAQEHIYNLPNGLLAYRLNGADNAAPGDSAGEAFAPTDIVVNLNATAQGLDPTIFIGSCGACHNVSNPVLQFTDQLKNHILSQSAFDADEKELASVFFQQSKMEGRTRRLSDDFKGSLDRLGVSLESEDPVNQRLINPFRKEMNASQVAGYLLMGTDDFLARLAGSEISSKTFGNLLGGGTVSLSDLSKNFEQLVEDVGAYKDISL